MPPYFRFLTLVGLRVFLDEAVDVAVMEVGVGGRFDCTNVIPAPVVCGITPLGFDHVNVLGHTIDEIAWNKAGIMKKGCPIAVTSPGQPGAAQSVLQSEADAVECRLTKAPPLDSYPVPMSSSSPPILGIHGPPQLFNASMALQLSETWLRHKLNKPPVDGPFPLDHIHLEGLKRTEWPGRCSIIQRSEKLRIHLDGAHTRESLRGCIDWFSEVSKDAKVAVFNITGGRDSKPLLKMLQVINFELVIFCPNLIHSTSANQPDLDKVAASRLAQLKVCESLHAEWRNQCGNNPPSVVLHSVEDVLQLVDKWENRPELNIPPSLATADHVDVLITGSLHLVGNFYALLNPDLNS